jgi:hypothetical protein
MKDDQKNSYPYRKGRVVTVVRRRQIVRLRSQWILIKQVGHEAVDLLLRHSCTKKGICQFKVSLSLTIEKKMGPTLNRFTAGIGQLWAFECQLLPTAMGAESPKMKLFDAVTCLESGLAEFDHVLDQSGQAAIHRWFIPLICDDWGGQEPVS